MTRTNSEVRSHIMRSVKRAHTKPELLIRKLLHSLGLRFRLNRHDLPGSPDIVLSKYKTAIFVHGCFWHRHAECRYATTPKTRQDYWLTKFASNVERDARKEGELRELGWRIVIIWECETRDKSLLLIRLAQEFNVSQSPPHVP
jgi:DNA mismatch endonuclease, patch repair protein